MNNEQTAFEEASAIDTYRRSLVTLHELKEIKGKSFYLTTAGEYSIEIAVKKSNLFKTIEKWAPKALISIIETPYRVIVTSLKAKF